METTTQCKICGESIPLGDLDTIDEFSQHVIKGLVGSVCHDTCRDQRRQKIDSDRMLAKKSEDWGRLCPPLYQSTDPSKIPNKRGMQNVLAWEYGDRGLIVTGKSYQGKTRSVWLMLKREFEAGRHIVASSHPELSLQVRKLSYGHSREAEAYRDIILRTDILFVDDLGKSGMVYQDGRGAQAEEFIWWMMDERMKRKLPCVFTTNEPNAQILGEKMSDRSESFVNRIRESCKTVRFE